MCDPTQRFSSRVGDYVRYRPGYPSEFIDLLRRECGLTTDSVIADVGSGTGKLTGLLLQTGCRVFGIEPNKEMREAGESLVESNSRFTSVAAAAEATTLPASSVDLITAGQAFHWFDRERARTEFERILKSNGWVALIWNERHADSTPFLAAYEEFLLGFATDYARLNHRNVDLASLSKFFGSEPGLAKFQYSQQFDFDGLTGRLLSSSYAPQKGEPKHEKMLQRLREIFEEHQKSGRVAFEYDTLVYFGRLK